MCLDSPAPRGLCPVPAGQVSCRGGAQEPGPFVPQASLRDPCLQSPRPKSHLRTIRLPGTWPLPVLPHSGCVMGEEQKAPGGERPGARNWAGWLGGPQRSRVQQRPGARYSKSVTFLAVLHRGKEDSPDKLGSSTFLSTEQGHTHGLDTEGHGDTSVLGRGSGATPTSTWVTFSLSPTAPTSPVEAGTGSKPVLLGGRGGDTCPGG